MLIRFNISTCIMVTNANYDSGKAFYFHVLTCRTDFLMFLFCTFESVVQTTRHVRKILFVFQFPVVTNQQDEIQAGHNNGLVHILSLRTEDY